MHTQMLTHVHTYTYTHYSHPYPHSTTSVHAHANAHTCTHTHTNPAAFWFYLFVCVPRCVYMCGHAQVTVYMEVRGRLKGARSLRQPSRFWRWNSVYQAWQQAPQPLSHLSAPHPAL